MDKRNEAVGEFASVGEWEQHLISLGADGGIVPGKVKSDMAAVVYWNDGTTSEYVINPAPKGIVVS